jgi:dTDP-4-dehydrorhamnose reductase
VSFKIVPAVKTDLNDNVFVIAKNIREHIIHLNKNKQLSVYDITDECIKYINNHYMNRPEEP